MPQTAQQKRDARLAREEARREAGNPTALEQTNAKSIIRPDLVAAAAGETAKPSRAGAKVIVACKLGVAYYDIQLSKMEDKFEQNLQGGRTVREATRVGDVVRLRGTAYPRGTPPAGFPPPPEIVNGAALNRDVDKEWFDAWLEQHKLDPLVKNKFIFAHETLDGVSGQARELKEVKSGLDPINPKDDKRITKSNRPSEVSNIEGAQRRETAS